jgi:four helix bundle protein
LGYRLNSAGPLFFVPTNLVEGCTRRSTKDYLHFVEISLGSASEVRYLLRLAHRLGLMTSPDDALLESRY